MEKLRNSQIKDIRGQRFGRLLVESFDDNSRPKYVKWVCKCDCGKLISVLGRDLRTGNTESCGCLHVEQLIARSKKNAKHNQSTVIKGSQTVYRIWVGMRSRCRNSNNPNYKYYGAKGITVCERWDSFEAFLEDMGPRPIGFSIDRIDVKKGYYKENCRWADKETQDNNRTDNTYLEYNGEKLTLAQWSRRIGISAATLSGRVRRGWNTHDILTKPV